MFNSVKILFISIILFIISCDDPEEYAKCLDDDGDLICNVDEVLGCMDSSACNYNQSATDDDGNCELNLFCYDSDGDGFGYGDTTQICLDEIPEAWVNNCDDDTDDCDGIKDDCGECNGNNQNKDCNGICFGTWVQDLFFNCCENEKIQNLGENYSPGGGFFIGQYCLPDTFKWSLTMTGIIGEYDENGIFIIPSDSISNTFTIGTHDLSTDELDIFQDMNYSDIVQPPSTVENSIYFYTSHPEWEYQFGNNFIQEYKLHNMDTLLWNGQMNSDYYGEKHVKITFELESEQNIAATINFDLNNMDLTDGGEDFSDLINPEFEYIVPIVFQGAGYSMPFSIEISNFVIY